MEMAEGTQIRENRGNHGGAPGGRDGKMNIKVLVSLLLAVCYMAGTAADVHLSYQRAVPVPQQGLTYEASVISGDIPGKTRGQCQRGLDGAVKEGMLVVSMNVTPLGKTTGADCSINRMIENPSNQEELVRVEITRDDTGEEIFEAGAIRPGNYLELGPLLIPLPIGEYDCTAVFLTYQEETETLMGQVAVKIKLVLQE